MQSTDAALVWMSAGNSYFKEPVVAKLLHFAISSYSRVFVVSPEDPAVHTFLALGYDTTDAQRKARLNARLLLNRALRTLSKLSSTERLKCATPSWKEIADHPAYKHSLLSMEALYTSNKKFREAARETTRSVLELLSNAIKPSVIDEAVKYLLKEFALIFSLDKIYSLSHLTYIYHKKWDILDRMISGEFDGIKKGNVSFLVASFD